MSDYIATEFTYKKMTFENKIVEKRLIIPRDFAMFTSAGNRAIRIKAESLVKKVSEEKDYLKTLGHFSKFFKSFSAMRNSKSYREAGDTEVRGCVWSFAERVAECFGIDHSTLDELWNKYY